MESPNCPPLISKRKLSRTPTPEETRWAEDTLSVLTPRQCIGQVLMPILFSWEKSKSPEEVMGEFEAFEVGGAFTFGRDWRTLREVTTRLQSTIAVPPLFSCDYECGPLNIDDGARFGLAMTLGAVADLEEAEALAYQVAAASAIQGAAAGTRWTFSPVVDLSLNRHNPIVNTRSYGSDPERVGRLAAAYVRGLQDHGMAATVKHFPGDGVDGRDQHLVTTVNDLSPEAWDRSFRHTLQTGIDAGASAVMMGHIALEFRSSRNRQGRLLPATMDPRMHMMLREEFGFDGVIVSDAINMSGLKGHVGEEPERALVNLQAGSDVVLFVKDLPATVARLEQALASGELGEERLREAAGRVLKLKAKLGLHREGKGLSESEAEAVMAPGRYAELSRTLNEKAVTRIRDDREVLPLRLKKGDKVVVCPLPGEQAVRQDIVLGNEDGDRRPRTDFELELQQAGLEVWTVLRSEDLERAMKGAAALIYCMEVIPEAGRGSIRLSKQAFARIDLDWLHRGVPVVFVSFGSPYVAWEVDNAPCMVCAYSAFPEAKRTAARALLGQVPFEGTLPVEL